MMVAVVVDGFFSVLNGCVWAPLETSQALFTVMQPFRPFLKHVDIFRRTDFLANPTSVAVFTNYKFPIHLGNLGKGEFIKR